MKFAPAALFGTLVLALTAVAFALALSPDLGSPAASHPTLTDARPSISPSSDIAAMRGQESNGSPTPGAFANSAPTQAPPTIDTSEPALLPPTPSSVSSDSFQQGMILRRDGDYTHAAAAFKIALGQNAEPSVMREIRFRLGESSWLAGEFDAAKSAFRDLIDEDPSDNLSARAEYFLADILAQEKAYSDAISYLRAYRAQTRVLMGEIDAQIGDLMSESGDPSGAVSQYEAALRDQTLTAPQRVDFLERIAGIQSELGHPDIAAARLGEAFALAPDDDTRADVEYRWGLSLDSAKEPDKASSHWQHALVSYPDRNGAYKSLVELVNRKLPVDDFKRGLTDYYAKSYNASILAFDRYAAANPKNAAAAHYYSGLAYLESGQNLLAVNSFDALLDGFPKDIHRADAIYSKAVAYDRSADTSRAVIFYDQFADQYPSDPRADDALWKAGQSLDGDGRYAEARTQYEKLAAKYPGSVNTPPALFTIGLDYFITQDLTSAESRWKTTARLFPESVDADRSLLWLGKLAIARGDGHAAEEFWKQATSPPRNYYSWRALDLLDQGEVSPSYVASDYLMNNRPDEQTEFERWLENLSGTSPISSQLGERVLKDFHFRRGAELAQLDRASEARIEFQKVNNSFHSDAASLYALARYYQENNYFDLSVDAASRIQVLSRVTSFEQLPSYLQELIYPTYFADLIVPYAQRGGIDPALLFALVRQESTFNPLSVSRVGAYGLTQVMPQTGSGIARDLAVGEFRQRDLLSPYISIRFGAYYYGQLLRYFDGNIFYALGGYNGGPGNAKKWVRHDVDLGVEAITLSETSLYVRTVYAQYNRYLSIYRRK